MQVIKTFPGNLGKYIKLFYSIHADEREYVNMAHRRLPDGTLDIQFNFGDAIHISRDSINFSKIPEVAITGLFPDRSFLRYSGDVNLTGVVFQPGCAHLFVNDALEQFRECTDDAALIFGSSVYSIYDELQNIPCDKEKHGLLENFLNGHLKKNNDEFYTCKILESIRLINVMKGNLNINELHRKHYMSEKNFRRKFNELVGLSPKKYATIIRIKSFSKLFESSGKTYSDILFDLGYFDQSHFNKEFQKIAGTNPNTFFNQPNKLSGKFIHLI